MLRRLEPTHLLDQIAHLVDGVYSLLGVCGVCRLAMRDQRELGSSSLAHLDVAIARLADDHVVGLADAAYGAGCDAFEALLLHHAGDADGASEIPLLVGGKPADRLRERRVGALHVARAPAPDLPIVNLCLEGGICPLLGVLGRHGVYVAIK